MFNPKNEQVIKDEVNVCIYCGHDLTAHEIDLNFKKIKQHGHCENCPECNTIRD